MSLWRQAQTFGPRKTGFGKLPVLIQRPSVVRFGTIPDFLSCENLTKVGRASCVFMRRRVAACNCVV